MLQKIDRANGTHFLRDILNDVELTERHKKLIKQQTTSPEEVIQRQKFERRNEEWILDRIYTTGF